MEKYIILFLILSLSSCNGDLGRLSGLLIGAGQQIHNRVHGVADAVLGGLNLNVHGHVSHHRQPVQPPSRGETIVVIVKETSQDNQAQGPPHGIDGTPQHGQYRPPNGYNPNHGHRPNHGHNPNYGYNPHHGHDHPRPPPPVNYGQGPYHGQNGHYGNGNYGPNQNIPNNPGQHGTHNHQNGQDYNQNGQTNNVYNGNVNPNQDGYGNSDNNVNNNPNPNGNEVTHPEQNKPNINGNYKPTEAYNDQPHTGDHQAENTHKEKNDITTKKPLDDGPLFVPLNDYTYGGDKITINAPKRETDKATTEESEVDFPIDIRFKDE